MLSAAEAALQPGEEAVAVVSSRREGPFVRQALTFEAVAEKEALVEASCDALVVDETLTTGIPITGFGGAFTDAAVKNLALACDSDSTSALQWLFSPEGMGYSLTRVHIGSCDFSERSYSYVPEAGDLECRSFALVPEDAKRMDWIRRAGEARGSAIRILASPWTAPPWMKDGSSGFVGGKLRCEDAVYRAWARYFVKFLSSYADAGLPVWAVTPQNEPNALPAMLRQTWETMFWDEDEMVRFIGGFLGPALAEEHPEVLIVAHDDQRLDMPHFIKSLSANAAAMRYTRGIGFHWYQYPPKPYGSGGVTNHLWSLGGLSKVLPHDSFYLVGEARRLLDEAGRRDALLVCTEMCAGFSEVLSPPTLGPSLGDWDRAEVYAEEILRSLAEGMGAWLDWNLVLDEAGGPNWAGNLCDAPLLRLSDGALVLQPACVAIAHFSHFLLPGAVRLDLKGQSGAQHVVAFACNGRVVVVVLHRLPDPCELQLRVPGRGVLRLRLPGHSIATVSWPCTATAGPVP